MAHRAFLSAGISGIFCSFLASSASALPLLTDDPDVFQAALNPASTATLIDFEAAPLSGTRTGGGLLSMTLGGLALTAEDPSLKILDRSYSGNHNTTVNGRNYLSIDTDTRNGTKVSFQVGAALYALSFNLIDHDTGDVTLTLGAEQYIFPDANDGDVVFVGLILDDPTMLLDQFLLSSERDGQFAIDDLFFAFWPVATATPASPVQVAEPAASLWMAMLGLAALYRRRKS